MLYTKPRNEKKAADRLTAKGYQVYCPVIRTVRQWSDRKKKVLVPMFSSYIFAYTDELERPHLLYDPGVLNFVFWLGKPALVRDGEMEAIKKIESIGDEIQVEGVRLQKGQLVTIPEGPFKGLSGKVDKLDSRKVIVFVEQLDCMVSFRYRVDEEKGE